MNLHWLRDKELAKQLIITWGKDLDNTSDYFTRKTITHHRRMRPLYVRDAINTVNILYKTF